MIIYIVGAAAMVWLYCYQKSPILWPVSAGAREPEFSQYFKRFRARVELEQRLFPIANRCALPLLVLGGVALWLGYPVVGNVLLGFACLGYIVLNRLPQFYPFRS